MELWTLYDSRWLIIGTAPTWEHTWIFDPRDFGLGPGSYQLYFKATDAWGTTNADPVPLNRYFQGIGVATEHPFYYAVDSTGQPRYYYQSSGGNRRGWLELDGTVSSINACRFDSKQILVAADPNGGIWTRTRDVSGLTNWQRTTGQALYPPQVVAHNRQVHLLVVGTDHCLYVKASNDGLSWPDAYHKFAGWFAASVTGVSYRGDIYLWAIGGGNNIYWCRSDGVNHSNWVNTDGQLKYAIAPTVVGNHTQLLGAGFGGELWHRYFDGAGFTRWLRFDGGASSDPSTVLFNNAYQVAIVGTDHCAYYKNGDANWESHGGNYLDVAITTGLAY